MEPEPFAFWPSFPVRIGDIRPYMPNTTYAVHFFCDECSQPHPLGMAIVLKEPDLDKKKLNDVYAGREFPSHIATMIGTMSRCTTTRKMVRIATDTEMFLVAVSQE